MWHPGLSGEIEEMFDRLSVLDVWELDHGMSFLMQWSDARREHQRTYARERRRVTGAAKRNTRATARTELTERVVSMHASGMSLGAIGRAIGKAPGSVHWILKRAAVSKVAISAGDQ
jgi:hypothetical protein